MVSEQKKTNVVLQFLHYPEYLTKGSYIFINESNLKVMGIITDLFYDTAEKFNCPSFGGSKEQRLKLRKAKIEKQMEMSSKESNKKEEEMMMDPKGEESATHKLRLQTQEKVFMNS
jgi:hypothetical protein